MLFFLSLIETLLGLLSVIKLLLASEILLFLQKILFVSLNIIKMVYPQLFLTDDDHRIKRSQQQEQRKFALFLVSTIAFICWLVCWFVGLLVGWCADVYI